MEPGLICSQGVHTERFEPSPLQWGFQTCCVWKGSGCCLPVLGLSGAGLESAALLRTAPATSSSPVAGDGQSGDSPLLRVLCARVSGAQAEGK